MLKSTLEERDAVEYILYYLCGSELAINLAVVNIASISLFRVVKKIKAKKVPILSSVVFLLTSTLLYNSFVPIGPQRETPGPVKS